MASKELNKLLTEYFNFPLFNNKFNAKNKNSSLKSEESDWLTSQEAANYLRIPLGTLKNWSSNGKLPFVKLGRLNRYSRIELEKLLLSKKRGVF